jgi:hypothetical protein
MYGSNLGLDISFPEWFRVIILSPSKKIPEHYLKLESEYLPARTFLFRYSTPHSLTR